MRRTDDDRRTAVSSRGSLPRQRSRRPRPGRSGVQRQVVHAGPEPVVGGRGQGRALLDDDVRAVDTRGEDESAGPAVPVLPAQPAAGSSPSRSAPGRGPGPRSRCGAQRRPSEHYRCSSNRLDTATATSPEITSQASAAISHGHHCSAGRGDGDGLAEKAARRGKDQHHENAGDRGLLGHSFIVRGDRRHRSDVGVSRVRLNVACCRRGR